MGEIEVFNSGGNMKLVYKTSLYFPKEINILNELATDLKRIAELNGFVQTSTVQINYGNAPRREGLITVYMDVEYKENHPFRTTMYLFE